MFTINDDNSIYLTRGDAIAFTVTCEEDGKGYVFQPGDVVRIKVFGKKDAENVVLQKDFPVVTAAEEVEIFLSEDDTKIGDVISKPKDYWYEVELNPWTIPKTIIGYDEDGAKVFKLFPEGDDIPPHVPVEPEDIPVVDKELDLASNRPVENQAVARMVARLEAAVKDNKTANAELSEQVADGDAAIRQEVIVERARIDNLIANESPNVAQSLDYLEFITAETKEKIVGSIESDGVFATVKLLMREANLIYGGTEMDVFIIPNECRPMDVGLIHTEDGMEYRIKYDSKNNRYYMSITVPESVTVAPSGAGTVTMTYALGNYELADIRVGLGGVIYDTAGEAVREQIADAKNSIAEFTGYETIIYKRNAYVAMDGGTADVSNTLTVNGTNCAVVPCAEGDVFTVGGKGGGVARLWGFIDADGNVLAVSDAHAEVKGIGITAPANSAYLVLHNIEPDNGYKSYKGIPTSLEGVEEQVEAVSNESDEIFPYNTNVFDPNGATAYSVVDNMTGDVVASAKNSHVSGLVRIPNGKTHVTTTYLSKSGAEQRISNPSCAFYDKRKNFIAVVTGEPAAIPSNAHYVRFCVTETYADVLGSIMFCFSETPLSFVPYTTMRTIGEDVLCQIPAVAYFNNDPKNIIADVIANGGQIKLLGDSITQGVGGTGFNQDGDVIVSNNSTTWQVNSNGYCWANLFKSYLERKFGCRVKNYGTRGVRSYQIKEWIEAGYLIEEDDDVIILMIGTNDKWDTDSRTIEDLKGNLEWIISWCHKNGKKIVLMSAPISSVRHDTTYPENTPVKYHNEDVDHAYMSVCHENNMRYISMYQKMLEYCDLAGIETGTILSDGLHPNDKGYYIMYKLLMRELGVAYQLPGSTWDDASPTA